MYRRHHASRISSIHVHYISCTSASDAVESPPSSTSSTDVTNMFLLKVFAAHNAVCNVNSANTIAHSIYAYQGTLLIRLASMTLQFRPFDKGQKTPLARSNSKPRRSSRPPFSNTSNVNVPKHNTLHQTFHLSTMPQLTANTFDHDLLKNLMCISLLFRRDVSAYIIVCLQSCKL